MSSSTVVIPCLPAMGRRLAHRWRQHSWAQGHASSDQQHQDGPPPVPLPWGADACSWPVSAARRRRSQRGTSSGEAGRRGGQLADCCQSFIHVVLDHRLKRCPTLHPSQERVEPRAHDAVRPAALVAVVAVGRVALPPRARHLPAGHGLPLRRYDHHGPPPQQGRPEAGPIVRESGELVWVD